MSRCMRASAWSMHVQLSACMRVSEMQEIYVSVSEAARVLATSRWSVFKKLRLRQLEAVKDGRRTLVTAESIKRHAETLPVATFGLRIAVPSEPKQKRKYRRRQCREAA